MALRRIFIIMTMTMLLFLRICETYISTEATEPANNQLPSVQRMNRVQAHLRNQNNNIRQSIFRISPQFVLTGPGLRVQLRSTVSSRRRVSIPSSISISRNGRPIGSDTAEVYIYDSHGYSFAQLANGTVIELWGPNLNLIPYNEHDYPGLFVNIHRPSLQKSILKGMNRHDSATRRSSRANMNRSHIVQRCNNSMPPKVLEIALAFDNSFCALYGRNTKRAVLAARAAVGAASIPFEEQACLRLAVTHIDAHCNDPNDPYKVLEDFSSTKGFKILNTLEKIWRQKHKQVKRDVTLLLVGFIHTYYFGQANIGKACNGNGFSWVERTHIRTIAHEIGHLLNCEHDYVGIMSNGLRKDEPFEFSHHSVSQILTFLKNDRSAKCIQPATKPVVKRARPVVATSPSKRHKEERTTKPPDPVVLTPRRVPPGTAVPRSPHVPTGLPPNETPFRATCGSSLTPQRQLSCTRERQYRLRTAAGYIRSGMRQRYGLFELSLTAQEEEVEGTGRDQKKTTYRIVRYTNRLTTQSGLSKEAMGANKSNRNVGIEHFSAKWSLSNLRLPVGKFQCCGREIYMYTCAEVLKTTRKANGTVVNRSKASVFRKFIWNVQCISCSKGKFIPASHERACPLCVKHRLA